LTIPDRFLAQQTWTGTYLPHQAGAVRAGDFYNELHCFEGKRRSRKFLVLGCLLEAEAHAATVSLSFYRPMQQCIPGQVYDQVYFLGADIEYGRVA